MTSDTKDKAIRITHSIELLFWLIIVLLAVMFCFFIHLSKINSNNEYSIFMPDVDGLIVGSPVRTMGVEVGYITKIKPTNNEVFVKFLITDKDITIPQGTKATVEFNGMAASKSLELYVPDENTYIDSTVPILTVEQPKRLHDAFGLLNEMFKKLGSIIYTTSSFGKKLGTIDFPDGHSSPKDAEKFLKYADEIIDTQQERVDNFGRKINNARNK